MAAPVGRARFGLRVLGIAVLVALTYLAMGAFLLWAIADASS